KAGFPLVLVDAEQKNLETAVQTTGGTIGNRETLAECDVIVLMLRTSAIVATVLLGSNGTDPVQLKTGAVVVDMSSSDPKDTVKPGERLAQAGIAMLDAPVSGGIRGAIEGTLAIMLGGNDQAAIEKARPIIESMSRVIRQ